MLSYPRRVSYSIINLLLSLPPASYNKNFLDCDQSNYSSPIIFSYTFRIKYVLDRMNRFRDMAIQNYTRRLTAAIWDLVQSDVGPFDPPTPKTYHRTKYEVDRMTRCRDMSVRNFPRCEVGRRSSICTLASCTPLRLGT